MRAELLAPAGSYEALTAAVAAGADAVYLGGSAFGARAYAKNFDEKEILSAIDYAHIHNRKLYLTVNTLFKQEELERELYRYLLPYYEQGLDAVIVQDLGAVAAIRSWFPDLPIHASTQMTITGEAGARWIERQGATRVVPARELSLDEISRIHRTTNLEIECFVHGALCYCYSGQCLFSSLIGGRSGNRGRCAQPCRLPYEAYDEKGHRMGEPGDDYPLSPKDMCTIELLPEILKAGVTSLKIEGRMKKPEYTAGVVSIYRKYLDLLERQPGRYRVLPEDLKSLRDIYHRDGFNRSYYTVRNGREMMALKNEKASDPKKAKRNEQLFYEIRRDYLESEVKERVHGFLSLYPELPASLTLYLGDCCVTAEADGVQKALRQPMTEERVRTQLQKTGNTPFVFENLEISMDESVFVPVQTLNELRRSAADQLCGLLTEPYRRKAKAPMMAPWEEKEPGTISEGALCLKALVETREQLAVVQKSPDIAGIYAGMECFREDVFEEQVLKLLLTLKEEGRSLCLALPHAVRAQELKPYRDAFQNLAAEGLDGFLVRNLESYAMLQEIGLGSLVISDYSLYTLNKAAQQFWRREGILYDTVPFELNERELAKRDNQNSEMVVYGYLPMMVSAQCVKKNLQSCTRSCARVRLKDRYGKYFTARCYCRTCYNVIYNSLPLGLLKEAGEVKALKPASVRLSFTLEDAALTEQTVRLFGDAYLRGRIGEPPTEYTKGHFHRKVE